MSVTSMEAGVVLDTTGASGAGFLTRGPRFIAEVFDGADEALAALEAIQGGLVSTGFQTLDWLTAVFEDLAPAQGVTPRVVVVTERNSGKISLVLPLIISRGILTTANFADLGVSDYGGLILGPMAPTKPRSIRRAWRAILRALPDVDLLRLERMPASIGGQPNPLVSRYGVVPARHSGNVVVVSDTVEAYLRGRGKKYRKEAERCHRLWEKEGSPRFYRATTPDQIARVYSVLEEQQRARHALLGSKYVLDDSAYRAFYERIAIDGSEAGLAALFALEANGEIVATLFGIVHDGRFTLLRISTAGDAFGHLSPGRLVIIEAMRHFIAEGVRTFDLGIGDYRFKRDFGAEPVPLFDLIIARRLSAVPNAAFYRAKARLRENAHARNAVLAIKRFLRP